MLIGFNTAEYGRIKTDKVKELIDLDNPIDGFAPEIIRGMIREHQDDIGCIRVSDLGSCVRQTYLRKITDYYESLASGYWMFRGQLTHLLCENYATKGNIIEKRFEASIGGIKISGKPDTFNPFTGVLKDFKTTKRVPKYDQPYSNHICSTSDYRWILHQNGYEVKEIQVIYLDMETTKLTRVKKLETFEETEKRILPSIKALKGADKTLPKVVKGFPDTEFPCAKYCPLEIRQECIRLHGEGK